MNKVKNIVTIWFSVLMVITLLLSGCTSNSTNEPSPPTEIKFSFLHGAPSLNTAAELMCGVITIGNGFSLKVLVDLPESLELVSGSLEWEGIIYEGGNETIKAVVRAVKVGHWEIKVHGYIGSKESGFSFPIYISIEENKAEWAEYPPWYSKSTSSSPKQLYVIATVVLVILGCCSLYFIFILLSRHFRH